MWAAPLVLAASMGTPAREGGRTLLGGQVGFDISKVANYGTGLEETRSGGVLAAYVALPISCHLWIQPDLSFTRRNLAVPYRSTNRIQLPFIEVAALPVIVTAPRSSYLFAGAGPALAIRVGAHESEYPVYYGSPPSEWRRASMELVAIAGVGARLSHTLAARLEFRNVHGLQDLDPAADFSDPQLRSWGSGGGSNGA